MKPKKSRKKERARKVGGTGRGCLEREINIGIEKAGGKRVVEAS